MNKELQLANELIDFIYESPTAFHAADSTKKELLKAGFKELNSKDSWNLEKGKKYFVTKNESAVVAFIVGTGNVEEKGFKIVGAHTDTPSFRIKPSHEMVAEGAYIKLNTEAYSGSIMSTWLDRPLSVAGRVTLKSDNILFPEFRLVNIKRPILIIPNLAIHLNRNINEGVALNKQKDMLPLLGLINDQMEKGNYLLNAVASELGVKIEDIIDFDLFLYEFEKGCVMGLNNEFISSPRLDDLSMVYAGLRAISSVEASEATNVLVCFDNEEVGSSTKQGAASPMLASILERIVLSLGKGREEYFRALSNSFIIVADSAHAVHPNLNEKYDPTNRTVINNGPVIKISANQKYTTDSNSSAVYEAICKKAQVPVQKFVNRSDEVGGSTIGPISSTQMDIRSVDMGTPLLAMHSIRELGGVKDQTYVTKSFEEFYKL